MSKVGTKVTVAGSRVTGIRIEPGFGTLVVEGVDVDAAGNTIASHSLSYPPEVLAKPVAQAVQAIKDFAAGEIDNA